MSKTQLPDLGDISVVNGAFNEQTYLYLVQLHDRIASLESSVTVLQQQVEDLITSIGDD